MEREIVFIVCMLIVSAVLYFIAWKTEKELRDKYGGDQDEWYEENPNRKERI